MEHYKDIVLAVDYHDQQLELRQLDRYTGEESRQRLPTEPTAILQVVQAARSIAVARGGQVVWLMESTTGWARVADLLGDRVKLVTANALAMPKAAAARRKKSDQLDTRRLLQWYCREELIEAYQPDELMRRHRRLARLREDLSRRRTQLSNTINRFLAHETWLERPNLNTRIGRRRVGRMCTQLHADDAWLIQMKLDELEQLAVRLKQVEQRIEEACQSWPAAMQLDQIKGIGPVAAFSILARVGDVTRFTDADALVAYAGLAPATFQSAGSMRHGHLASPGTDKRLRHYVLEAAIWAAKLPRYQPTYERVCHRRGSKIARLVVARRLLRSIYQMLTMNVAFDPGSSDSANDVNTHEMTLKEITIA